MGECHALACSDTIAQLLLSLLSFCLTASPFHDVFSGQKLSPQCIHAVVNLMTELHVALSVILELILCWL